LFSCTSLIRARVSVPVTILIDVYNHGWTVYPYIAVVVCFVFIAPVMVPVTVMTVIMVMPLIMIPVVVVPVMRSPWTPVSGIVTPVPGWSPYPVPGMIYIIDYRPCTDIIIARIDHIWITPVYGPCITRVGCFCINGFNNIIWTVECLIPDKLYLHSSIIHFFHNENSDILLFVSVQSRTHNDGMDISFLIIRNRNIIYELITVQVQVINHGLIIIQASLKSFQGLWFLEQVHYGIEI
jgi:hypothetical protein